MDAKLTQNQGYINELPVDGLSNDVNQVIDCILEKKSMYTPRMERGVRNKNTLATRPLRLQI
jgi:hypothetical protein